MTDSKQWDYTPSSDKMKENAALAATAGLYGLALSQIFNPVAIGMAATCAVIRGIYLYRSFSKEGVNRYTRSGDLVDLPEQYSHIQGMADQIAKDAGINKPIKIYRASPKILPDDGYAGALPSKHTIIVSKSFLKEERTQQEFILAHEIAHIAVQDASIARTIFRSTPNFMAMTLAAGLMFTSAGGIGGIIGFQALFASGVNPAIGAIALYAASIAAYFGNNHADRIAERRADRNAIYLTRDVNSATEVLRKLHPERTQPPPIFELHSHPSYHSRIANLRAAFKEASAYPPPLTATFKPGNRAKPPPRDIP